MNTKKQVKDQAIKLQSERIETEIDKSRVNNSSIEKNNAITFSAKLSTKKQLRQEIIGYMERLENPNLSDAMIKKLQSFIDKIQEDLDALD